MFVRFVTRALSEDSRSFVGVFSLAYDLRDSGDLSDHELESLDRSLAWLKTHLKVPKILEREEHDRAICWFKPVAKAPIQRVWEMIYVMREHGILIEMIKIRDPGTILYEDGWQVVAIPHRADRVRVSQRPER